MFALHLLALQGAEPRLCFYSDCWEIPVFLFSTCGSETFSSEELLWQLVPKLWLTNKRELHIGLSDRSRGSYHEIWLFLDRTHKSTPQQTVSAGSKTWFLSYSISIFRIVAFISGFVSCCQILACKHSAYIKNEDYFWQTHTWLECLCEWHPTISWGHKDWSHHWTQRPLLQMCEFWEKTGDGPITDERPLSSNHRVQ